jgi:hypothetical protein
LAELNKEKENEMISIIETGGGGSPGRAVTIADIEKRAAVHASARAELANELDALRNELESTKKKHIRSIKILAAAAAQTEADLRTAIEMAPELFKRPKTLTLHGIKVGYRTAHGKIVFEDEETTIKLIRRHFKDKEDLLIRVKESVNKDGLKTLTEAELSKASCRVAGAGDRVVLEPVDDEVEKLVSKLIQDMVDVILEEERQAA